MDFVFSKQIFFDTDSLSRSVKDRSVSRFLSKICLLAVSDSDYALCGKGVIYFFKKAFSLY